MSRVEGKGYADTGRSGNEGEKREGHPDIIFVPCPVASLVDFASTKGSVCASEQDQRSADRCDGNIKGEIGRQRHREVVVQSYGCHHPGQQGRLVLQLYPPTTRGLDMSPGNCLLINRS